MNIEKQNIEMVQTEPRLTVEFSGGNCTLGYPKLEPANVQRQTAYDKTIALIASCLQSVKIDGKVKDYQNAGLHQKICVVQSWSYAQMKAVTDALPAFLGDYYLNLEKENGN